MELKEKQNKGFTLLEILVALALFSVSVLILTQSFINGLLCKNTLSKENTHPFILQMIRSELQQMKRDDVKSQHHFSLPDNKTQISWQATENFSQIANLYRIQVSIKEDKEQITFFIRHPDWMTQNEKDFVLKRATEEREDVIL